MRECAEEELRDAVHSRYEWVPPGGPFRTRRHASSQIDADGSPHCSEVHVKVLTNHTHDAPAMPGQGVAWMRALWARPIAPGGPLSP